MRKSHSVVRIESPIDVREGFSQRCDLPLRCVQALVGLHDINQDSEIRTEAGEVPAVFRPAI